MLKKGEYTVFPFRYYIKEIQFLAVVIQDMTKLEWDGGFPSDTM